jgi:hypothetical protein
MMMLIIVVLVAHRSSDEIMLLVIYFTIYVHNIVRYLWSVESSQSMSGPVQRHLRSIQYSSPWIIDSFVTILCRLSSEQLLYMVRYIHVGTSIIAATDTMIWLCLKQTMFWELWNWKLFADYVLGIMELEAFSACNLLKKLLQPNIGSANDYCSLQY